MGLVFSTSLLFGQGSVNFSPHLSWKSEQSILLQFRATNFQNEQLAHLKIVNKSEGYQQLIASIDSIFLGKGISSFKRNVDFSSEGLNAYEDTLFLQLELSSVVDGGLLARTTFRLLPNISPWANIQYTDSSLLIQPPLKGELSYSSLELFRDSVKKGPAFQLNVDSSFAWHRLIQHSPLHPHFLVLRQENEVKQIKEDSIWYEHGRFYAPHQAPQKAIEKELKKKRKVELHGELGVESNFFTTRPQHANGTQYPFTSFQASNTISVYGIPFTLNASHSTNENINANFRNFFSLQFDVRSFRKGIAEDLLREKLEGHYSIPELENDIDLNGMAIDRLKKTQSILEQYPNASMPSLDSLLNQELNQANAALQRDSLIGLDSLLSDSLRSSFDSLSIDTSSYSFNQLNERQAQLEALQHRIDQLQRSNALKSKYLNEIQQLKRNPPSTVLDPRNLSKLWKGSGLGAILLRVQKFEIGNFFEYAGQYSIRDVELKGVNTSFLLNSSNELSILYGQVNDFQSFNLDNIKDRKEVRSIALRNSSSDYFQPSIRLTQYKDLSINPELSNLKESYYVLSLNSETNWDDFLFLEAEVNRSGEEAIPIEQSGEEQFNERMAYYTKAMLTPFSFLDLKLQYDQVGSRYRSDGVYFLNRNTQTYTLGYKLRLFKNKLHFKNDYSILNRNFEQKNLTNQTRRLFFDAGTHFKRIPNLQVSYSPISVEVANRLDTSFSGIDANTNVLIARLFYLKKVKRTVLSTALVYNEIENELAEDFSTQKGVQHFINVSNEKVSLSFTSAYDKLFSRVRFVSSHYTQQLSPKLAVKLAVAKNFSNHFYSEVIRSELSYQFLKQFTLGAGGIFLIEAKRGFVNTGGSFSLRYRY